MRHVPRCRNHERDGVLRRRDVVAFRRVHHHDAAVGGRRHIDVIHANARSPDHTKILGRRDDIFSHLGATADHQAIDIANQFQQLIGTGPGSLDDFQALGLLKNFDALRRQ